MSDLSIELALREAANRLFTEKSSVQEVIEGYPRLSSILRDSRDIKPEKALAGWYVQNKWVDIIARACSILGDEVISVDCPYLLDLGDGLVIQCHPDVVTRKRVWEIKSTASSRFAFAKIRPFKADLEQLQVYLEATGREEGVLLYEDRDTLEIAVHLVQRDQAVLENLRAKLLTKGEEPASVEEREHQQEVSHDERREASGGPC